MGLDFPDAPALDEEFAPVGLDKVFHWDGFAWVTGGAAPSAAEFLPLTGGTLSGPLTLPVADPTIEQHATHKKYVDVSIANQALYQSTWQVAANTPDLDPAVALPLHGYSWTAVTVNAATPETAPTGLPGIGGTSIASGDTIKYNANLLLYEHIRTASSAGGIGDAPIDGTTYGRIDAGWVNVLPLTGGTLTGNLAMASGCNIDFLNSAHISKVAANNGLFFHTPSGAESVFHVSGTGDKLKIASGGVTAYGLTVTGNATVSGNSTVTGVLVVNGSIDADVGNALFNTASFAGATDFTGTATIRSCLWLDSAYIKCPEGSKIEFNNANTFIASTANTNIRYDVDAGAWHGFWVDSVQEFYVDSNGGAMRSLNSVGADLGVAKDEKKGGTSIAKVMIAMMAKIKQLETELATLRPRR